MLPSPPNPDISVSDRRNNVIFQFSEKPLKSLPVFRHGLSIPYPLAYFRPKWLKNILQ